MFALQRQRCVETPGGCQYRLDFALEPLDAWLARALVDAHLEMRVGDELDGHAFHERTPQQVIARDRRDRDLSALRWRILHFSGSELHRNPMGVIAHALPPLRRKPASRQINLRAN